MVIWTHNDEGQAEEMKVTCLCVCATKNTDGDAVTTIFDHDQVTLPVMVRLPHHFGIVRRCRMQFHAVRSSEHVNSIE